MKCKPISGGTTGNLVQPPLLLVYRNRGEEKQYAYLNLGYHLRPQPEFCAPAPPASLAFGGGGGGGSVALFLCGGRRCIVCAFCLLHLESWLCLETGNRLLIRVSQLSDGRGDV